MENLTEDQLNRLLNYDPWRSHTMGVEFNRQSNIEALIAEVREWRRRGVTSERYDNELVIAEDEKQPRVITREEWDEMDTGRDRLCDHARHWDCGDGWVCYPRA